jgi:hypothetical protein
MPDSGLPSEFTLSIQEIEAFVRFFSEAIRFIY